VDVILLMQDMLLLLVAIICARWPRISCAMFFMLKMSGLPGKLLDIWPTDLIELSLLHETYFLGHTLFEKLIIGLKFVANRLLNQISMSGELCMVLKVQGVISTSVKQSRNRWKFNRQEIVHIGLNIMYMTDLEIFGSRVK
jgi:hypothetical protein